MKILVVHISTIENEIDASIQSIKEQTYKDYDIYYIKNKGKVQAHNVMYKYFMENDNYDILVKVDGDMVINNKYLLERIIEIFKSKNCDKMLIPVYDYFTEDYIIGMTVFNKNISWQLTRSNVFTDRKEVGTYSKYFANELKGSILHCVKPNKFQSFHYGLQRGYKAFQPTTITSKRYYGSFSPIIRLCKKYELHKDRQRFYAIMGFFYIMVNPSVESCVLSYGKCFYTTIERVMRNKYFYTSLSKVVLLRHITYLIFWFLHRLYALFILKPRIKK